jgi:hypothetical protein
MAFQSKLIGSSLVALALGSSLTGCGMVRDYLEKKGNEALADELKKDADKKRSDADSEEKAEKGKGDAADAKAGETWTETITGSKIAMERVDLSAAGLQGFSILAPKGAKSEKALGGNGVEVTEFGYGYSVWVTEDPTASMDAMKKGAEAWFKGAALEDVDGNSFVVKAKSYDGADAFYYRGVFKANGKTYRCETPTSVAPTKKLHAEQIDKACESLQLDGKPIGSGGTAAEAAKEPEKTAAAEAPNSDEKAGDTVPAKVDGTPKGGATTPAKTEPAKTEPAKTEPAKTEPAKTEPAKTEPAKTPAPAAPATKGTTRKPLRPAAKKK